MLILGLIAATVLIALGFLIKNKRCCKCSCGCDCCEKAHCLGDCCEVCTGGDCQCSCHN